MRLAIAILASVVLWLSACAQAQPVTREQAVAQLVHRDVAVRRAAVDRLGEVGVMADVTPLLAALRDDDESTRDSAEQAIWRIWSRSGKPDIDALYATGVAQMSRGEVEAAMETFS